MKKKKFQREICPYGKVQNPLITPSFQGKLPTKLGFRDITIFLKNSVWKKETKE